MTRAEWRAQQKKQQKLRKTDRAVEKDEVPMHSEQDKGVNGFFNLRKKQDNNRVQTQEKKSKIDRILNKIIIVLILLIVILCIFIINV